MGTRATFTVSLILVGWSGLIWLNREQVMAGRPLVHAGFWMAIGLILLAKGAGKLRADPVAGAATKKRPGLAWLIGSLPVFTWLATRWRSIPFVFTESSYAPTLSASAVAAMVALLAALATRTRLASSIWTSALRLVGAGGATAAFILVGVSVRTHLRIDHSETGTYGEMDAALFVVEHPIFWAVAIVAAFALLWSIRSRG